MQSWTRDLTHAKRALYHFEATSPSEKSLCYRYSFRLALDRQLWLSFGNFILVRAPTASSFLPLPLPLETVSGMYKTPCESQRCGTQTWLAPRALLPGAWTPNWHPTHPARRRGGTSQRRVPARGRARLLRRLTAQALQGAEVGVHPALCCGEEPSVPGTRSRQESHWPLSWRQGDLLLKQSSGNLLCTAENLFQFTCTAALTK